MKFLFKYPTRGRPDWFKETLTAYHQKLSASHECQFLVTMDEDDPTMNNDAMRQWLDSHKHLYYGYGPAAGKIHAINRDMPKEGWDVVVLVSDDMLPLVNGFDDIIAQDMQRCLPAFDGVLHYWDHYRPKEDDIVTWTVMGRAFYEQYGFLYYPAYKGMWCDNELTDISRIWGKYARCDAEIIKHQWQKYGVDAIYERDNDNFHADKTLYEARKAQGFPIKYSQNDEDVHIRRYFGDKHDGRFLDIGAGDGVTFSNTKLLYDMGWRGVAVEPSPNLFPAIKKNCPELQAVEAALMPDCGMTPFFNAGGDFISTTSQKHKQQWEQSGARYTQINVGAISWQGLINDFGTDFDFLNLDIEGENIKMLRQIPKGLLERLQCACIEYDYELGAAMAVMGPYGFKMIHQTGENVIVGK